MFDQIPVRVWLLIAIAAVAYAPARYVYRHIAHSPSRRDITQPPEDLSWRTPDQFVRNMSVLAALLGLAIFIFTPAAERFGRSPLLFPFLITGLGAWALFTVLQGFVIGQIQPFVRGIDDTYDRGTQPKRFWASLAWNGAFGGLCLWLAFKTIEDATARPVQDRCHNQQGTYSPQEMLSACNQLVEKKEPLGHLSLADVLLDRGIAYARLNDHESATADYAEVLRRQPDYYEAYYNRGLIYQQLGDSRRAITDYGAAIRLRPNDSDAYLNRGLIFLDTGRFDEAVADFTRAHELRPKDPWPLANRGITYAWKRDQARARRDFSEVRAVDPSNPVLLRGEALLAMNAGDMTAAVNRLSASLKHDPDNAWALRKRAEAYRQLGEIEKSQADTDTLLQVSEERKRARLARE